MKGVVYDVEVIRGPDEVTDGWNNPEAMGLGTIVMYNYEKNLYSFADKDRLEAVRQFLTKHGEEDVLIGFNNIIFDNRVIFGNDFTSEKLNCYDILQKVCKGKFGVDTVEEAEKKLGNEKVHDGSISLNAISKATLNMGKIGHGANAPLLLKQGRLTELFAYNLHDVRLTRLLYEFIQQYGFVIDGKGNKVKVAFPK